MKIKKLFLILIILMILAGIAAKVVYKYLKYPVEKQTRFMMDTYVTIHTLGPKDITVKAVNLAFARMQQIDEKFNALNVKSPLYAYNKYGVAISDEEILKLIETATKISRDTNGAFDITVYPLIELWGFYTDTPSLPADEKIKNALSDVNFKNLIFYNGKLTKHKKGVAIDLGGIAKGYAIKEAARVLKGQGVNSAVIDAGGDVYVLGKKGNKLWRIGIKNPRAEGLLGYLEAEDLAVVGSGDYERFFIKDGKRYHHIMNPRTGYPAQGLSGITVIYPDPVIADAWATALFVLGAKDGIKMAEKIPGMEVIMVTVQGEKIYTPGLKKALKLIPGADKRNG